MVEVATPSRGLSPLRYPRMVAQPSTNSILPRSRLAVSGFVDQIGSITRITSATSMSRTGNPPNIGEA